MNARIALGLVLFTIAFVNGCTSTGQRLEQRARGAGFTVSKSGPGLLPGYIYMKAAHQTPIGERRLFVFLEGDGLPWRNGREPSTDPTSRNPIALELAIRSPAPAAYITRPCYNGLLVDQCNVELWTGARYSNEIVESMVALVREAQQAAAAKEVVLIGYSGGGVLAVLIAERLDHVAAVMTLAANLDVNAWTEHHGYLPLSGSLDPARSERGHPWPELHLQGALDTNVPVATTQGYFDRYPSARKRVIEGYDHACCWVRDWEQLLGEIGETKGLGIRD